MKKNQQGKLSRPKGSSIQSMCSISNPFCDCFYKLFKRMHSINLLTQILRIYFILIKIDIFLYIKASVSTRV